MAWLARQSTTKPSTGKLLDRLGILPALKWLGSQKRKRARSAKPGRDATRSGGGKGPTKGGAPCVIECRGMSPEKILPWAMRSLEANEG